MFVIIAFLSGRQILDAGKNRYKGCKIVVSMENYYFLEGDHRRGPFRLDQLKTYPISPDTPIWKDSRNEWTPAEELDELRGCVVADDVKPARPGKRHNRTARPLTTQPLTTQPLTARLLTTRSLTAPSTAANRRRTNADRMLQSRKVLWVLFVVLLVATVCAAIILRISGGRNG